MSDSNLPQVGQKQFSKELRQSRLLLAGGAVTIGVAAGMYLLTYSIMLTVGLAMVGVVLLGARQLIKNSLALTSPQAFETSDLPLDRLEDIRKQVSQCKFLEKVELEGSTVADQATQLVQQYKNLKSILNQKFEPTELTYSRYESGVIASCLAIGENLLHVKSMLENLNVMNPNATTGAQTLWKSQKEQVTKILDANASALVELGTLFHSLNQILTKEKHRDQFEQSMEQIRQLAERAKQYSKQ
jgi:hypothetical protein